MPQGSWLPVTTHQHVRDAERFARLRRGLEAAGQHTRIDEVGTTALPLSMLRVLCPHRALEAAEQWLFDLIRPFDDRDEPWASDIDCLLHQRWQQFTVWSGGGKQFQRLTRRLQGFDGPSSRAFAGSRYAIIGSQPVRRVSVFQRSAAEVLPLIPGVVMHGPSGDADPHAFVAIVDGDAGDAEEIIELEACLQAHGIATRRYELTIASPRLLLCAHDAEGDLGGLRERIRTATASGRATWRRRSLLWPSLPVILVHRCEPSAIEALVARIEAALPDVALEWSFSPGHAGSGHIAAQLDRVDDVLTVLRTAAPR